MLITTTSALEQFCRSLEGAPYLAIDTEFIQEKSYYPRLCLIQVAHGDIAAAIDPLAARIDLTALRTLLYTPTVTKVFHAARMDLAIFLQRWGAVPTPVFDTQIAASVCGLGQQAGYARLVDALLGIQLDKSAQATDWSLRPLTSQQVAYALGDVTHLCHLHDQLQEKLRQTGRDEWIRDDMQALGDPERYVVAPSAAWRAIRARRLNRKALAVLRELAAWREQAAQDRDLPRQWVMHDKPLLEIAQTQPRSSRQLSRVRGLKPGIASGTDGQSMLRAVQRALEMPPENWPTIPSKNKQKASVEPLISLLQALLHHRCRAHEVAAAVIAKRADLYRIATEADPDVPALQGWRRGIFGADAQALCAGKLALSSKDGEIVIHPLE